MVTQTQLARLGLFDAKVPRYTSYPTAPHFGDGVGASEMRTWIQEIAPDSEISLYVHVPFCRRLCWFCACRTQGTTTAAPVAAYLDTLKAEIALLKQVLPDGVKLSRLHWGGGTPTLLSPYMIDELAEGILAVTPLAEGAEFSVEIDPNELDLPRLEALARAGMNRASIGVQDFDKEIQACIGRDQSFDLTRDTVEMLRDQGIDSLNADILFGLPHQTPARITSSVQQLLALNPDRVALYGYAHVPWMAKRQQLIPSDALPTPAERLALFETARRLFLWDGYDEIGIDHFARSDDGLAKAKVAGSLRRNFQGYTDDKSEVLIGLGASSISRFPKGFTQNASGTSAHTSSIRNGDFSTSRGHAFAGDDTLRARLIEAVMCDFRIDATEIQNRFDLSREAFDQLVAPVAQQFEDLVQLTERGLFIPPEARSLTRNIARAFDAYDLSKAGHSSAI